MVFIAYFSSFGKPKMLPPRLGWQFLTLENANSKVWSWHNQVSIGEQTFPYIRVQRETFFQSRDENEICSYSISHINIRRDFPALSLRLQDKTEKNFLSYSRQDRETENNFHIFTIHWIGNQIFRTCFFLILTESTQSFDNQPKMWQSDCNSKSTLT